MLAYCKSAGKKENYVSVRASEVKLQSRVVATLPVVVRGKDNSLSLLWMFLLRGVVLQFSDKCSSVLRYPPRLSFFFAEGKLSHLLRERKYAFEETKFLYFLEKLLQVKARQ